MNPVESNSVKRYLTLTVVSLTAIAITQTGFLLYWAGRVDANLATLMEHSKTVDGRLESLADRCQPAAMVPMNVRDINEVSLLPGPIRP